MQFDKARNGVKVKISWERDHTISFFSIERVLPSDSGEYFCDPDGLSQARVILHVLNGKCKFYKQLFMKLIFLSGKTFLQKMLFTNLLLKPQLFLSFLFISSPFRQFRQL